MMDVKTNEECWFFVDDSNVWIEAQKFAASGNSHMPKLADGESDPRLRINTGRLVNTLCNGRTQCQSYIYGSRPPPNDLVWKQYEECRFQTKIYDRGANGKEKEVDNSMAVDMSKAAARLEARAEFVDEAKEQKLRTVFVVITGDRDLLPAVKSVLDFDIRVELWGWNSGMANEYLRERNANDLLSVKFLAEDFIQVSFTNYSSTRNATIDPAKAIVVSETEGSIVETWDDSFVAKTLLQLDRLFHITRSKTGPEIIVEFPRVTNIEAIIQKAQELFGEDSTIISWPVYASWFNKKPSDILEKSNKFEPLGSDDNQSSPRSTTSVDRGFLGYNTDLNNSLSPENKHMGAQEIASLSKDPDDDGGWQTVSRSQPGKAHATAQRRSQKCPNGQHCGKRGECGYKHTDKELGIFRDHPRLDFTKWKAKPCKNLDSGCRKGERCPGAHSEKEAWCLSCRDQGHYTGDCKTQ